MKRNKKDGQVRLNTAWVGSQKSNQLTMGIHRIFSWGILSLFDIPGAGWGGGRGLSPKLGLIPLEILVFTLEVGA